MNTPQSFRAVSALLLAFSFNASADEITRLEIRRTGPRLEINWPAIVEKSDGSIIQPYFEVQRSVDLQQWQPMGERQRAATATPGQLLGVTLGTDEPHAFYRLLSIQPRDIAKLGTGGAEVFGYGDAFAKELKRIGQISPEEFAAMFPTTSNYLSAISWDPTTAQFWEQFNTDPDVFNSGKTGDDPTRRLTDFRLDQRELAVLKTNGFVVSERLGSGSFADLYYKLWKDDLPVFVSTDAILQAWHRTYDAMLEEIEETYLFNSVGTMLDGMAAQVAAADAVAGNGVLHDSLRDADWFLAVARSLLAGTNQPPVASVLAQDARVAATLTEIQAQQLEQVDDFMGFCRMVDFSQFKIRGHYTRSERLGRYFQCVMWLGRIDVPVAGGPWERCPGDVRMASPRELGTAIVFWHLLNQSGRFQTWADMEKIITAFVGWTDSLNFGQLNGLLAGAGIRTLADVPDLATLRQLQTNIINGGLGVQNIRSDWFGEPLGGAARSALPQTFTVFGQKFVPDSWAFSQTVFSSILWAENGVTNKVNRRVPGALDAAFAVLGNDQIVPDLVARMKGTFQDPDRPHAQRFRDGLPYQHNLAAVRAVMDLQTPDSWASNIDLGWLDSLRQLSPPTTDAKYPEAMRTRAWAMKSLNTQLASWTQLRHDTILYAKQSYTGGGDCVYPQGFVEPRVEFWSRLRQTAARAAELIGGLNYEGSYAYVTNDSATGSNIVSLATIQSNQVAHLRHFGETLGTLQTMAEKELAQECFNAQEELFIRDLIQILTPGEGSGGIRTYTGWYPQLFYRAIYREFADFHSNYGAETFDAIVADVHTDVPTPPDPGSVLHEAVGRVNLLMLAVDNGIDHFICAGPVLSHYELEVLGDPRRLSDPEWGGGVGRGIGLGPSVGIIDGNFPPDVPASRIEGLAPPVWTKSYLVPLPRP